MSVLDRARAFSLVAAYLTSERRQEVAEAIAADLSPKAPKPGAPVVPVETEPDQRAVESRVVAEFLEGKGFEHGRLVRAAARIAVLLDQRRRSGIEAPASAAALEPLYAMHREELERIA